MLATPTILSTLVTDLESVTWTPGGGAPEAAFQAVELWRSKDLIDAFKDLLINRHDRVCIVVWTSTAFGPLRGGAIPVLERKITVTLVMSDRILGDISGSRYGTATHPGVLGLLDAVSWQMLGSHGTTGEKWFWIPRNAETMSISDETQNLPSREVIWLDCELNLKLTP